MFAVELTAPPDALVPSDAILSLEERERAESFRFPHLRRRFIVAHACLRLLIASYLHADPASIQFGTNRWGKPSILGAPLDFNLSHSADIAVFAFTSGCAIGVDVEQVRPMPDMIPIARRLFAKEECADLLSTPAAERNHAFFRCWTRKEAFIKAAGQGLSYPLDRFRVSLLDYQAALLAIDGSAGNAREWAIHHLEPAPGYVGAVVARGPLRKLCILPAMSASRLLEQKLAKTPAFP